MTQATPFAEGWSDLARAAFDRLPSALYCLTEGGVVLDVNRFGERFLSASREDLLGQPLGNWIQGAVTWDLTSQDGALVQFRRGESDRCTGHVNVTQGEAEGTRLVTVHPRGAWISLGALEGLDTVAFEQVFAQATDAIAIIDHEGRYLYQNPAHSRLLGYTDEQLVDRTPAIHIGPVAFQEIADGLAASGTYAGEHISRKADGELVRIELTAFTVDRGPDLPPVFVGFKRRLGERDQEAWERADEERRELEEGLRQAHKMEAIGQLAAGVAHDFNNLLTPILGHADAELAKLPPDSDLASSLGQIRIAAERGRELTRQLLTFGRKQEMKMEPTDLGGCIERVAAMLDRVMPEGIELETSTAEELPQVLADATAIEQVVMNLATNSRDAFQAGGCVTLGARLLQVTDQDPLARSLGAPGKYVELFVEDNGPGIDPETRTRVFEPFYTTKPPGRGTGLGLSIVHTIVRQHQGLVLIESEAGEGTTVRVFLSPTDQQSQVVQSTPAPTAGAQTILVAEDEALVRSLVRRMLMRLGYTCLLAANGQAALELARNHPTKIDLLLTDMGMPGMDGIDLHRRLRELIPDLPVVYMSGYPPSELDQEDAAFLQKPFFANELMDCLARALQTT